MTLNNFSNKSNSLNNYIGLEFDQKLLTEISNLSFTNELWVFCDFDDTLFSREEQLKNPLLKNNRGYKGNKIIIKKLGGYKKFVEQYYYKEGLASGIVDIIKKNISFILSTGDIELQELKIKKVGLDNIPRIIVSQNSNKPLAILDTIIKKEKIPSKILILDDKVQYFCKYGQYLSNLLGNEIIVKEVKLNKTDFNYSNTYYWKKKFN